MSVVVTTKPGRNYDATLADVARCFGFSYRTARRYTAAGIITGHRVGPRMIRFNLDDVREQLIGSIESDARMTQGKRPRPIADPTAHGDARLRSSARSRR